MKKLFLLLSFVTFFASAEPLKIVIAYPPGGATDTAARILAKDLSTQGIETVVINQGGGAGRVALVNMLNQKPDGNTILFTGSGNIIYKSAENPEFYADMRRLTPVAKFAEIGYMIVVKKDSRMHSWHDLDQAVRSRLVNIGGSGTAITNFISELWPNNSNVNIIPYNSDADTMMGLLSTTVDVALVTNVYAARVESGELNALALTNTHGQFGVKSLRELGVPLECQTWNGVFAPPGTPTDIVQKLYTAIERTKNNQEVREELKSAIHGVIPKRQTPEEFNRSIEVEYTAVRK